MNVPSHSLSSDRPEDDPEKDLLGYAPFAKNLAKGIVQMTPETGIVIGIYAPWGAGKTTLLNFVQHFLCKYPEVDQPVIVPFNPWWFSGQEDLANSFFQQLLGVLGKDEKANRVRESLERYAKFIGSGVGALATAAGAVVGVPVAAPVVTAVVEHGLTNLAPKKQTIHDVKSDVEAALKETHTRLLVIIDDIDRLTAEETRQLFRVVKAVADFRNVIYLLAFDNSIAAKALETVQVGDGNAYLEKIVQVPFTLPLPENSALGDMLSDRLRFLFDPNNDDDSSYKLWDVSYWTDVYQDGIRHFIETPRDVVRLANTISVTYSSVRGEVNPVDFVAIETLRVFAPSIYDTVRSHSDMFAGNRESIEDYDKNQFKEFHTEWFQSVAKEIKQPIQNLLLRLFPKLDVAWDIKWMNLDNSLRWSRKRRIADPNMFPVYFRLALPTDELSQLRMREIIGSIGTSNFKQEMVRLQEQVRPDGSSLARRFLERFEDYTEDLNESVIHDAVQGIFDAGDGLIANEQEKRNVFMDMGIDRQIGRTLRRLLFSFDEQRRSEILKNAIQQTSSYYTVADEVGIFGYEHGKYGGQPDQYQPTVSIEHLAELEEITRAKIKELVRADDFKGRMHLTRLLHVWLQTASKSEVGNWIRETTSNDDGLLRFLDPILNVVNHANDKKEYRLDPFWLQPFLEQPEIEAMRVRLLAMAERNELSDKNSIKAIAGLQFLQEYENRDDGFDADSPFQTARRTVFERYQN